jgi:hypothetical protein
MTRVRVNTHEEQVRHRPQPVPASAPTRHAVLDLQRTVGNAATTALVQRSTQHHRAAGAPVLNQPIVVSRAADFGLRTRAGISGYAGPAADFWKANPDLTLQDLGVHLMDEVNKQLLANGVPPLPAPVFMSRARNAGGFAQSSWTVQLDLARTAKGPLTTKIGTLTADRVAEVASVCFHEGRHAEQAFTVARMVAAEGGKDAKVIAAEVGIPEWVAKAALAGKGPLPGKTALADVKLWRAIGQTGKHSDYWTWNEDFRGFAANVVAGLSSPSPSGVDAIIATREAFAKTLAEWQKDTLPFLDRKIDALTRLKRPDTSDTIVLRDVRRTQAAVRKVVKQDAKLAAEITRFRARRADTRRPITVPQAAAIQSTFELDWIDLEIAIRQLSITADAAYEAYPHEADAYATGKSVEKAFLARAKAPAGRP